MKYPVWICRLAFGFDHASSFEDRRRVQARRRCACWC